MINLALVGLNASFTFDRYGTLHSSPFLGATVGKSATILAASFTSNWLNQSKTPSQSQLNNFLTSNGFNFGGGMGYTGTSLSYTPGSGTAWGVGLYSPQIGGSYNYTPALLDVPTNFTW